MIPAIKKTCHTKLFVSFLKAIFSWNNSNLIKRKRKTFFFLFFHAKLKFFFFFCFAQVFVTRKKEKLKQKIKTQENSRKIEEGQFVYYVTTLTDFQPPSLEFLVGFLENWVSSVSPLPVSPPQGKVRFLDNFLSLSLIFI